MSMDADYLRDDVVADTGPRQRSKLSPEEMRAKRAAAARAWRLANPERVREITRASRARVRARNPSTFGQEHGPLRELERVARLTVEWLKADPAVPQWSYEMLDGALKALKYARGGLGLRHIIRA